MQELQSELPPGSPRFPLSRRFDATGLARLQAGFEPEDMNDRWRVLSDGQVLRFYRSWTGHCIYQLRLSLATGGGADAIELTVNGDPNQYRAGETINGREEIEAVERLLELLFGV